MAPITCAVDVDRPPEEEARAEMPANLQALKRRLEAASKSPQ